MREPNPTNPEPAPTAEPHSGAGERPARTVAVLPVVESGAELVPPQGAARYQKLRALGAGGTGEVDLWHDQDIDRDVAVKRLKLKGNAEVLAQFVQEIKTTGQLEHPGIVPIYDVGVDEGGQYFFVMKHVQGETLEKIIEKLKAGDPTYLSRFSYESRTQIFMQILRAVQYAHRKGFIHCDIKPANVIVGPFGEVMVLDWGLAAKPGSPAAPEDQSASRSKVRRSLRVSGTPDYMAPEHAQGQHGQLDVRSDTYCLCVLFYELITLHYYLSPAPTVVARLTSVVMEEPLTAIQMHHKYGAPPELTHFIRHGLAKDPAQRYQTVDEMIEKLQSIIDGYIPIACPCTGVKRVGSRYGDLLDSNPYTALVLLGLLGIASLFGIFEAVRLLLRAAGS